MPVAVEERKTRENAGRSPVLPEARLLHSSTVPLCSIVANASANDMHLWKQHERAQCAGATDSWKMAASVVAREGGDASFACLIDWISWLACSPVCRFSGLGCEQHLAVWQPTKPCPGSDESGETRAKGRWGFYTKVLKQSALHEMGGVMSGR